MKERSSNLHIQSVVRGGLGEGLAIENMDSSFCSSSYIITNIPSQQQHVSHSLSYTIEQLIKKWVAG